MITCKNVRAAMINLCFSLQSHTFIARLKHTNSGKKASCARQNAAFTPRKSIHSTISRYDIGFRTTLQKNNTQKTKNNMLGNARNRGKSEKIGRLSFGDPFFHSTPGSETLETGANRKNRQPFFWRSVFPLESRFGNARSRSKPKKPVLPFRMSFFPLKSRIIGVNNNYVNITKYVKLRYFL